MAVLDQVIIPSAMAMVVQMTNLKAAVLSVIANLALTSPERKMPPSAESGKWAKPPVQAWRSLVRSDLQSVARFWLFFP